MDAGRKVYSAVAVFIILLAGSVAVGVSVTGAGNIVFDTGSDPVATIPGNTSIQGDLDMNGNSILNVANLGGTGSGGISVSSPQVVTSSRTPGTTYTNDGENPMIVSVTWQASGVGSINVDGARVSQDRVSNTDGMLGLGGVSAVVPSGSDYTADIPTSQTADYIWAEQDITGGSGGSSGGSGGISVDPPQDVTDARSPGTTYTNDWGHPILVSLTPEAGADVYIDGELKFTTASHDESSSSFFIPSGSSYRLEDNINVVSWIEQNITSSGSSGSGSGGISLEKVVAGDGILWRGGYTPQIRTSTGEYGLIETASKPVSPCNSDVAAYLCTATGSSGDATDHARGAYPEAGPLSWDKKRIFTARIEWEANAPKDDIYAVGMGIDKGFSRSPPYGVTHSNERVAFYIPEDSNTLQGQVRDSSSESSTNLMEISSNTVYQLKIVYKPANVVEFYVDGNLKGTVSSNLPSGIDSANRVFSFNHQATTDNGQRMIIYDPAFYQAPT